MIIVYYAGMMWRSSWIRNDMAATREAMLAVEHICPDGSQEVIERWAELGYSRSCMKDGKKNGKSVVWEGQKLHMEGNYQDGKGHGRWTVYKDDGSIYRIIEYDAGKEISSKIINP
jgi:hypothetical protein